MIYRMKTRYPKFYATHGTDFGCLEHRGGSQIRPYMHWFY